MRIVRIPVIALLGVAMVAAVGCSQKPGGESAAGKITTTKSVQIVPPPPAPAAQAKAAPPMPEPAPKAQPEAPKPAPAPAPEPKDLIANGAMDKWTQLPETLAMNPPRAEDAASTIAPYKGEVPGGGKAVKQTWKRSDAKGETDGNYDAVVPGLSPNTTYRLSFKANNLTKADVVVSAWGMGGEELSQLLLAPLATKKGFQEYELLFTLRPDTKGVRIMTSTAASHEKFSGEVAWMDWKLMDELPEGWSADWGEVKQLPFKVRVVDRGAPEGGKALEQTWERADATESVDRLMGTMVAGLKQDATYHLTFSAANMTDSLVHVAVLGIDPADPKKEPERLLLTNVEKTKEFQVHAATFNSGAHQVVRIVTAAPGTENAFPVTVLWGDWSLVELPSSAEGAGAASNAQGARGEAPPK